MVYVFPLARIFFHTEMSCLKTGSKHVLIASFLSIYDFFSVKFGDRNVKKIKNKKNSLKIKWSFPGLFVYVFIIYCNWLSPKCKSQQGQQAYHQSQYCNWLSPKCKSQLSWADAWTALIVTDYRLNANHNEVRKGMGNNRL